MLCCSAHTTHLPILIHRVFAKYLIFISYVGFFRVENTRKVNFLVASMSNIKHTCSKGACFHLDPKKKCFLSKVAKYPTWCTCTIPASLDYPFKFGSPRMQVPNTPSYFVILISLSSPAVYQLAKKFSVDVRSEYYPKLCFSFINFSKFICSCRCLLLPPAHVGWWWTRNS